MPEVFISYARASALSAAQGLRDALTAAGTSVFLDEEGIPPGSPFPTHIADALLAARIIVVFADETYFSRPWCVYEFQVGIAPYRALAQATDDTNTALQHMVIALPDAGASEKVTSQLPPPLAQASWPHASQTEDLVKLIAQRLVVVSDPIAKLVEGLNDQAVKSLRDGALVPAATKPHPGATYLNSMPPSLKERFVGRTETLWQIFNALETKSAEDANRSCSVQGGAGMGKTQIAAEYVSRYGAKHYPGGIVWIDANDSEEGLARQFHEALQELYVQLSELRSARSAPPLDPGSFGDNPKAELPELVARLKNTLKALTKDGKVLWVIDNVPEPSHGRAPEPLSFWCPPRNYVSLLCTSRRNLSEDVDTVILLNELSVAGAVDFLSQPPVKKDWLRDDEWEEVARWVGCWPLGLRILQTGLARNFITAEKLAAKARGDEPADALDAEIEVLRPHVAKGYLHGVAEVLHVSYDSLKDLPEACRGAHLFARLARTTVPQKLLSEIMSDQAVGILSDRSLIQATESSEAAGDRRWAMHRVTASYLRGVSVDPTGEFKALVDLTLRLSQSDINSFTIRRLLKALARWLNSDYDPEMHEAAKRLAVTLATEDLANENTRGIRFSAAEFGDNIGAGGEIAGALERLFAESDQQTALGILYTVSGLSTNERAARLLAQALKDPRDQVRWSAYSRCGFSSRVDLLAEPLLAAYMAEKNANVLQWADSTFEHFLYKTGVVRTIISLLLFNWDEADAMHRKLIAGIFGRILGIHKDSLEAGGYRSGHIRSHVLALALNETDSDVATACIDALAFCEHPSVHEMLAKVIGEEKDKDRWKQAVNCLVTYVSALEKPGTPEAKWIEEDGEEKLQIAFGRDGQHRPDLFGPLLDFCARTSDPELRDHGIKLLEKSESGKFALQHFVWDLMEKGQWNEVRSLADGTIGFIPEFTSSGTGNWWRGQAYDALKDRAAAIADYDRVIELMPNFAEAYLRRGMLLHFEGDDARCEEDLNAVITLDPGNINARYNRAALLEAKGRRDEALSDIDAALALSENFSLLILKAQCLLNLGRYEEAFAAAERGLKLNSDCASLWYMRGIANYQLNRTDQAINDLEQALIVDPTDEGAKQFLGAIRDHQTQSAGSSTPE